MPKKIEPIKTSNFEDGSFIEASIYRLEDKLNELISVVNQLIEKDDK